MDIPYVELETTMGNIVIELNQEKSPNTVANFLEYVKSGHYDGTIFHRVIDGFMIQGGGMDANMTEKSTNAPIQNEADNGLKMKSAPLRWHVLLTHIQGLRNFFINVKDNSFLNFLAKPTRLGLCGVW